MHVSERESEADAPRNRGDGGARPAWIDSQSIFGGRDEVVIKHGDQLYRLRITRYGKLILNK